MRGTRQDRPHGWLKNNNAVGDFSQARRCAAKTRRGTYCQCPAMRNGRCRLHGGLSTGPKTAAGIERIQKALTRHGFYSKAAVRARRQARVEWNQLLAMVESFRDTH